VPGSMSPRQTRPPGVPGRHVRQVSPARTSHSAASALRHASWSRAWPGPFTSANRTMPDVSTRNVPRTAMPALSLNTP